MRMRMRGISLLRGHTTKLDLHQQLQQRQQQAKNNKNVHSYSGFCYFVINFNIHNNSKALK